MVFLLRLFFFLVAASTTCFAFLFDRKKCYGDLGCFAIDGDFVDRPAQLLPLSPETLRTRFLLNTRWRPMLVTDGGDRWW